MPHGTASTHLRQLTAGDTLYATVRPCRHALRIEHNAHTPLIMVAAGAGLAPFRAAIADRRTLRKLGADLAPAQLYYGCRNDSDYLYRNELIAAHTESLVRLQVAFSRPRRGAGRYVQDALLAEANNLRKLIAQGARIHVCGDAFRTICLDGTPHAATDHTLTALVAEGRYVEDVYKPACRAAGRVCPGDWIAPRLSRDIDGNILRGSRYHFMKRSSTFLVIFSVKKSLCISPLTHSQEAALNTIPAPWW